MIKDESIFLTTASNPASMNNLCYTFIAEGVKRTTTQQLEKTEDIDVCELTEVELLKVMESGQITQGDMLSPLWQWMFRRVTNKVNKTYETL